MVSRLLRPFVDDEILDDTVKGPDLQVDDEPRAGPSFHKRAHYSYVDPVESTESFRDSPYKRKSIIPKKVVLLGVIGLILICIIFIESSLLVARKSDEQVPPHSSPQPNPRSNFTRSCLDLKRKGDTGTGVKSIHNTKDELYDVFCDMDTDGGGWTLVASVHENDIKMKCDSKDRWSIYVPNDSSNRGRTAWENKITFGTLNKCTSSDYKIEAYYSLQAEDIMIWQVPNLTPLNSCKDKSVVRYRTTNNFLSSNGGNLLMLFQNYYELSVRENYPTFAVGATTRVITLLQSKSEAIKSNIDNWHDYTTWGTMEDTYIDDGWIYCTYGNQVVFRTDLHNETLTYNQEDWWGSESKFSTIPTTTPIFITTSVIRNTAGEFKYFEFNIQSEFESVAPNKTLIKNDIELGDFKLTYRGLTFSDTFDYDATACEFHFYVYNEKDWSSKKPASFDIDVELFQENERKIGFKATGSPSNIVMGYVLLATKNKDPEDTFSQEALDKIALTILQSFVDHPNLVSDFGGSDGISAPLIFDKGDKNRVLKMVPSKLHKMVEPGFLQLRAYNENGFPNALCPGIRMNSSAAAYTCVGGVSNDVSVYGTCGDFAGWDGKLDSDGEDGRSAYAHSLDDIDTTLLIFYR